MNKFQTNLLITSAIAISLVLGKSLAHPTAKTLKIASFIFPKSVPLSQWQLSKSGAVSPYLVRPPAYISGNFIAGKHYRYRRNNQFIDIEMRYLSETNGDLKGFITQQTGELLPVLRNSKSGFYSLYEHQGKAYLSACINPRGGSTVTSDRFNRNRQSDIRLNKVIPWFLGESRLVDRRCLWAHLSMPLDRDRRAEETYRTLENIWFDWHNWWQDSLLWGAESGQNFA